MVHAKNESKNNTVWLYHADSWVWQRNFGRDNPRYSKGRVKFWIFSYKGDWDRKTNSIDVEKAGSRGKVTGIVNNQKV